MARHKPRREILFLLFRLWSFVVGLLPFKTALRVGQVLGRFCFYLLRKEREKALENLDIAFGSSKSFEEKKYIVKSVFENLGKNLIEVALLPKLHRANIDAYIECKRIDIMERIYNQGKGGIALSAHFGNWELLAHYFAIKGYRVNVVARRMRNKRFEEFLDRERERNKVKIIYRDRSVKALVDLLKKNELIGMMPDQDIDSVKGVFVDFFGKKAYTPCGPAILNFLTGALVIPCFIIRRDFGHEILIEEPVKLHSGGDRDTDILENTQKITGVIESYVRRFPSQWVWFHERWKTRPE